MSGRVRLVALRAFGRLPRPLRGVLVRLGTPSYTVGVFCVIVRGDGAMLLIRHSYRPGWGLPGGLVDRGEAVERCAIRETSEEVGLDVELVGDPAVVVDPGERRVDVVFKARPVPGVEADALVLGWPEIVAGSWFAPDVVPGDADLQADVVAALEAVGVRSLAPEGPR